MYDRVGAKQNAQGWYEDAATDVLLARGDWRSARAVFEMGCGTGRLAAEILRRAPEARYVGTDLSPAMVGLARERLAPFGDRATVRLVDGGPPEAPGEGAFDRFVAAYVLDLLSDEDARGTLAAAHAMLRPGGLLCLAGLAPGHTPLSRAVAAGWRGLWRIAPEAVGGCRPVALAPVVGAGWEVVAHERVAPWGVPSEALVARRV